MSYGHNPVWDVGQGVGTTVPREGGNVPQSVEKTDPLPGLRNGTYCGFDGGAQMDYAWDGSGNGL